MECCPDIPQHHINSRNWECLRACFQEWPERWVAAPGQPQCREPQEGKVQEAGRAQCHMLLLARVWCLSHLIKGWSLTSDWTYRALWGKFPESSFTGAQGGGCVDAPDCSLGAQDLLQGVLPHHPFPAPAEKHRGGHRCPQPLPVTSRHLGTLRNGTLEEQRGSVSKLNTHAPLPVCHPDLPKCGHQRLLAALLLEPGVQISRRLELEGTWPWDSQAVGYSQQ